MLEPTGDSEYIEETAFARDHAASGHPSQAEGEDPDFPDLATDGHAEGHPSQAEGDDDPAENG